MAEEENRQRLATFLDVSVELTQEHDVDQVLHAVVERAIEATRADYGAVAVLDHTGSIDRFAHQGLTKEEVDALPHLPEGRGLLGEVFKTGTIIRTEHLGDHEASIGFPDKHVAMEAFMGVPLSLRGRLIGAIYLSKGPDKEPFSDADEEFIQAVAAMAAIGISNARLFEEDAKRSEHRDLLQQIAWTVRHSLDITDVLTLAVETLAKALIVDRCYVRLADEDGSGNLGPVEVEWDAIGVEPLIPDRLHQYPVGRLSALTRLTQWSQDVPSDARFQNPDFGAEHALAAGVRGSIATPLEWGDELMGIISLQTLESRQWTRAEISLVENAAREVSVALHHARLYHAALNTAEQLKQLDESRSDFLSMVSHELRSPMTVVSGIAHILKWKGERLDDADREELLNTLERESRRLSRLVSEFLDLEAIERGKIELRSDEVDLSELATEALVDAGQSPRATIAVSPGDCKVKADRDRVKQVLLNLLNNATKFSPDHAPVELIIEPLDDLVQISIVDHGPGIKPDDIERLFHRFSRLQTTVKQTSGSGIGLYVSKTIIELHGGEIWVESEIGSGASFHFTLPR